MGADWYSCGTFFGYKISVPEGTTYRKFVRDLSGLCDIIQSPFKITGLLANFHSRMEGMEADKREYLDNDANIIIGFRPDSCLSDIVELNKELLEYITDNPIFEGIDISKEPAFYSGIEWVEYYLYYDDSDEESDDNDSTDSDSCKVHPQ